MYSEQFEVINYMNTNLVSFIAISKQRVSIARTWINNLGVILCDEPTVSLTNISHQSNRNATKIEQISGKSHLYFSDSLSVQQSIEY